jgi:hypothetical protein
MGYQSYMANVATGSVKKARAEQTRQDIPHLGYLCGTLSALISAAI